MESKYAEVEVQLRTTALELLRVAEALALNHPVQAYDELTAIHDHEVKKFTGYKSTIEWARLTLLQMLSIEGPR